MKKTGRVIFLNLPSDIKIVRRERCTYHAIVNLFPPIELLYLATTLKKWNKARVKLVDAVAEELKIREVLDLINRLHPQIVVSLIGIESFDKDIKIVNLLKEKFPDIYFVIFGYLPAHFPKETLTKSKADFILMNEYELTLSELYNVLIDERNVKNKIKELKNINGIAFKDTKRTGGKLETKIVVNKLRIPTKSFDEFPIPDRTLLKNKYYYELFLKKPFTTMLSSKGCPFKCSFCIHTYPKFTVRSAENIFEEIKLLYKQGFKHVRIIDDTFMIDKEKTKKLARMIINSNIKMSFSCLSRVDLLDEETIKLLGKAGFVRIYLGVESASQRVLNLLNKGYKLSEWKDKIKLPKKYGIETFAWFITGIPGETEEDIKETINFVRTAGFDFITVSVLSPYPGTPMFLRYKSSIEFSLFPFKCEFKDEKLRKGASRNAKRIMESFYMRASYILTHLKFILLGVAPGISFLKYLLSERKKIKENFI